MGWGKMAGGILARENIRGDYNRQPPPDNCSLTTSEVEELNGKVQFSSKVHFYGELELNLVHFLAK